MAGVTGNSWKWLEGMELAGKYWTWLEMAKIAGMFENGWK